MKTLRNISLMALAAIALYGCESYNKVQVNPKLIEPSVFTAYPTAIITLDKQQPALSQISLAWSAAKYGYSAAVRYTIQVNLSAEPQTWIEVGQTNQTSIALQTKIFNAAVVDLGAVPLKEVEVNVRLLSSIGPAAYDTVSLPAVLAVIPFSTQPTPLWITGEYSTAPTSIYSENSNGLYKGWIYMNQSGVALDAPTTFKFSTKADGSGIAYGGTLIALSPDATAPNIQIANGYCYLFDVDIPALAAKIEHKFTRMGMIGSATPNSWDTPDTELVWDPALKVFRATNVEMKAGAFKFRADDKWDVSWGEGEKPGLLNIAGGGGDITFSLPDGKYTVTVDLCKMTPTYQFEAQ